MKRYTCELCNGNQFAKSENFFVCQQCGVKYSADEMKKLLSDFPDDSESSVGVFKGEAKNVLSNESFAFVESSAAAKTMGYVEHSEMEHGETVKVNDSVKNETRVDNSFIQKSKTMNPTAGVQKNIDNKSFLGKAKTFLKKIKVKHIILGALAIFSIVFFIIGLVKATDTSSNAGNIMLIVSGIAELILAFILYKVMIHIERYNCPNCAAKRVHHRRYVRTSEVDKNFPNQGGTTYKTIYTHHYIDTYECPSCGETKTEYNITKSGGEYTVLGSGAIRDTRKPPKEF